MTPLERAAAYGAGERIDRLPCVPIVGNTAARVIGVKISDFIGNGALLAQAHVAAYRRFGYDNIRIFTDLYTLAEAMGAQVHHPEDETAYLAAPAFETAEGIERIAPLDTAKDGQLPQYLEAMKIAIDEVGGEVPVTGALTGPFTNASFLVGTETLLKWTLRDPDAAHRLLRRSLDADLVYAKAILETGCTPSLTEPMGSGTVVSRKTFETFVLPYLKELIDYIHGHGRKVTLHICGKTDKVWSLMADAGADCLSIDNDMSLAAAKAAVGDRVRLMGNIRPSEVLLEGTTGDVRAAAFECMRQAADSPKGLIVASGCSLATETPFENIDAMVNAVREAGYPVECPKQ